VLDLPPAFLKDAFKNAVVGFYRVFRPAKTFVFDSREYRYFYHPYNLAWRNERSVEIPIALDYLRAYDGKAVLEVGNVLSHYVEVEHDVLDKYEDGPGIINEDAVDFHPDRKYDLIVSVSTIEHIGWDESPRDPDKARATIENLRGLLAPGGELFMTAALGLNPAFDRLIEAGTLHFENVYAFRRLGRGNEWVLEDIGSVLGTSYAKRSFRANAIVIGSLRERHS